MKCHSSSLPLLIMESIWFLEKVSTCTSIEFLQYSARLPPRLFLSRKNKLSNSILCLISCSLASFAYVSAKNTIKGSLARIITTSPFIVRRFPSPRQFHTMILIVIGGAVEQPLPLKYPVHPLLKLDIFCKVT